MNETFESNLSRLKERFRHRVAEESFALEVLVGQLERGVAPPDVQFEVRRIAHSLAGTGGVLGFTGISACAAELEEFVLDSPGAEQLAGACRALVSEMRRAS